MIRVPSQLIVCGPLLWLAACAHQPPVAPRLTAETLERLVRTTDDGDPQKLGYRLRLARHYQKQRQGALARVRDLQDQASRAKPGKARERLAALQKPHHQARRKWTVAALKLYLEVAGEPLHEKYGGMDRVLLQITRLVLASGRPERAGHYFGRLIHEHPQSRYIAEACVVMADHYFDRGDMGEARRLYQQAARFTDSPVYGYVLYRLGWCWLSLSDPRQALGQFVKALRSRGSWKGTRDNRTVLEQELLRDLVWTYSQVGRADRAWHLFRRAGQWHAQSMLEALAGVYYRQGKYAAAVKIYRKLIALFPWHRELCDWQYRVLKVTLTGSTKKQQVVEGKRLLAIYQFLNRRGGLDRTVLARCRANASGVLRELATTWHREAQKTRNQETHGRAELLYRQYLKAFPGEQDAYEMTYYHAELLYKLRRWEQAARRYTRVVQMKPGGKYLRDAAYAAVISWRNALNVKQELRDTASKSASRKRRSGRGRQNNKSREHNLARRLPIPARTLKMIAAFETYIKHVPKSDELVSMIYRKARIYYDHNHYDEAVKNFAIIATSYADDELGVHAARLLLDSLNITKKYYELNRWVDRFLKDPRLTKIARGSNIDPASDPDRYAFYLRLRKLKRGALLKEAEDLRKQGRHRECGRRFVAIANEYQEYSRWVEMVDNAAACFEAARMLGQAISIRNTLIRVKPEHPYSKRSVHRVGANYQAIAWHSRSAEYYERFVRMHPGARESPVALHQAILFRLGRGRDEQALWNASFFFKSYCHQPEHAPRCAAVYFLIGSLHERQDPWNKVVAYYQKYRQRWGAAGGVSFQIRAQVKIGELLWRHSCPGSTAHGLCMTSRGQDAATAQRHFQEALVLYRGLGGKGGRGATKLPREITRAAAAAAFHRAEKLFEEFLGLKLQAASMPALTRLLEQKALALKKARAAYQQVMAMKVSHWTLAGAARVGQLYQLFAEALARAPAGGLRKLLKHKRKPLVASAVSSFQACLDRSRELAFINRWSTLCVEQLHRIDPARYRRDAEIRPRPGYVKSSTSRAAIIGRAR